jgi:hypothetical protein
MLAYPGKKLVSDSNLSQQRYVVVNNGKGKNGRVDTCLTLIAISAVCFALLVCLGVGLHLVYDSVSSSAAARKPECEDVVLVERKWRAAEDRANRFESELLDVRRKHRALEDDYRELAMTARSQQAQQSAPRVVTDPPQDISAMQRLAKCRASVEASTEAIRELREHNTVRCFVGGVVCAR